MQEQSWQSLVTEVQFEHQSICFLCKNNSLIFPNSSRKNPVTLLISLLSSGVPVALCSDQPFVTHYSLVVEENLRVLPLGANRLGTVFDSLFLVCNSLFLVAKLG